MREQLQGEIERFAHMWCQRRGAEYLWRQPIVRFADAASPSFAALKEVVDADHHLPVDFLPEANTVISLFLPFVLRLAKEAIGSFDLPKEQERCLHKQGKKCLVCVKRCINGALGPDSFDRFKCLEQCLKNERELGADVCGKCIVGLPCSC